MLSECVFCNLTLYQSGAGLVAVSFKKNLTTINQVRMVRQGFGKLSLILLIMTIFVTLSPSIISGQLCRRVFIQINLLTNFRSYVVCFY